ncbi:MAG: type II toxin-antitoxin system Phd/YefM family antitoxin [Dehalococcoidia bacterium]|nr:type II toxin-antitoxin system Phd/YefM family antitoxin [Dehalococcoidia bacterium]
MIAIKTADLTQNFKRIAEIVVGGEKVLISRPKNENLVILTEKEFNKIEKSNHRNSSYQKVASVNKFLDDVTAIKNTDNILTDMDWDELANIRSQTNFARKVAL